MFKKSVSIKTVKRKLSFLPWFRLIGEKQLETGETNLYYDNAGELTTIFFDSQGRYITGETLCAGTPETPLF